MACPAISYDPDVLTYSYIRFIKYMRKSDLEHIIFISYSPMGFQQVYMHVPFFVSD